jgi:hypothetical protein
LIESDLRIGHSYVFTRIESVDKPSHDLALGQMADGLRDRLFSIQAWTVGVGRHLAAAREIGVSAGGQATFYGVPRDLESLYGDAPWSMGIFLRVAPQPRPSMATSRP